MQQKSQFSKSDISNIPLTREDIVKIDPIRRMKAFVEESRSLHSVCSDYYNVIITKAILYYIFNTYCHIITVKEYYNTMVLHFNDVS